MDGTVDLLTNLLANSLTALIARSGRIGAFLFDPSGPAMRAAIAPSVEPQAGRSADRLTRVLESLSPDSLDRFRMFLNSPEAESIVRQLFAARQTNSYGEHIIQMNKLFADAFTRYTAISDPDALGALNRLLEDLGTASNEAINQATANRLLASKDSQGSIRSKQIRKELASLQAKLDFLTEHPLSLYELARVEADCRARVAHRFGTITPPHLDRERPVPIDSIYVQPTFQLMSDDLESSNRPSATYTYMCARIHRTVVLGSPGAGKSTFARRVCYGLASSLPPPLIGARTATPYFVELREYAEFRKQSNNIRDFIVRRCAMQASISPDQLEYLLLTGRALVVFDGLDEVTDLADRAVVRDDVDSFADKYPETPILVTSREVGYFDAPLDLTAFSVFRISAFGPEQVRAYTTKWFDVDEELDKETRTRLVEEFLRDSQDVADLRQSPLMLGLMCGMYRYAGYIPRNRPGVYEKCALMLFEQWDTRRRIHHRLPFRAKVFRAIEHLAHWIYTNQDLQSGVPEKALVEETTAFLREQQVEDEDEARLAAQQFVQWCRGRAWVFTSVGSRERGELFQFSHRTFLEYFTAAHLVRNNDTENLASLLIPRIRNGEWDMVVQLAFQIRGEERADATDRLVRRVLAEIPAADSKGRAAFISFLVRSLGFLVPSPAVVRNIVEAAFARCNETVASASGRYATECIDILRHLLSTRDDNARTIERSLSDAICGGLESGDAGASLAIEIAFDLASIAKNSEIDRATAMTIAKNVTQNVRPVATERLCKLAECNADAAHYCWAWNVRTLGELLECQPVSVIFGTMQPALRQTRFRSIAAILLGLWIVPGSLRGSAEQRAKWLEDLAAVGPAMWRGGSLHDPGQDIARRCASEVSELLEAVDAASRSERLPTAARSDVRFGGVSLLCALCASAPDVWVPLISDVGQVGRAVGELLEVPRVAGVVSAAQHAAAVAIVRAEGFSEEGKSGLLRWMGAVN